jgi:hypothetical protein
MDACPELPPNAWEEWLEEDRDASDLPEALLNRLLRRLAEAWDDLNYQHLRSRLKSPSIRLHEGERRWGSWDPQRRLITISKRQVSAYTWESAIATLKHEMAHQFVSEILEHDDEPAHGESFKHACRLLAVDPAPRGDGGVSLLRPGGPGRRASADDSRLLKIHKLLSLADNNPSEHEARAAFARASELMLKYNLDSGERLKQDCAYAHLGTSSGRVSLHQYAIAGILQEFFFVQCIWVDSYVVLTGVRGHILEIMGTQSNVDMADYVYTCLLRQCEALWLAFKAERQIKRRSAKREYLDGLLAGFRRQLITTTARSKERGLVWVGDPALDAYSRARHPRTTRSRLTGVVPSEIRDQGIAAGQQMRLHRPVGAEPQSRGRLLPG